MSEHDQRLRQIASERKHQNVIFVPDYEEIPSTTLPDRNIQCFVWDAYSNGYHQEVGQQTWNGPLKNVLGEEYTIWMKKITYLCDGWNMMIDVEVEVRGTQYILRIYY